jgi:hypothetical protein
MSSRRAASLLACAAFVLVVVARVSAADDLVLHIDRVEDGPARAGDRVTEAVQKVSLPRIGMRLESKSETETAISVLPGDVVDSPVSGEAGRPPRVRLVSSASGSLVERSASSTDLALTATVAFGSAVAGDEVERVFDIEVTSAIPANSSYGESFPLNVRGWRRSGTQPADKSKAPSFRGVVWGHFAPSARR